MKIFLKNPLNIHFRDIINKIVISVPGFFSRYVYK